MDYISLRIENHIGFVTIDRPPVNAINIQLYREIRDLFQSINKNQDIWLVILNSKGKHFSTGNDVADFTKITTIKEAIAYSNVVSASTSAVYECQVPIIAAVRGLVLGAGLGLASCCDILVSSENAKFGMPEVKVGIVGGAHVLSRILPQHLHRYMSFSGDMMTAEQMRQYGAVLKVVKDDQLLESVMEIAEHILSSPPRTLKGFKLAMNKNENAQSDKKYAVETKLCREMMYKTEDFTEALAAFFEKRKPVYKGR